MGKVLKDFSEVVLLTLTGAIGKETRRSKPLLGGIGVEGVRMIMGRMRLDAMMIGLISWVPVDDWLTLLC